MKQINFMNYLHIDPENKNTTDCDWREKQTNNTQRKKVGS